MFVPRPGDGLGRASKQSDRLTHLTGCSCLDRAMGWDVRRSKAIGSLISRDVRASTGRWAGTCVEAKR
jgi:hypothetical protein